ncbi:MAG: hypothetical protein K4571_20395 [Deltaproteobacteria bacterium]
MKRISVLRSLLFLVLALTLLAGCKGGSDSNTITFAPLSADNLNLIFVVSPDLAHNAAGDIHPDTANLTNQGLQRSLLMATFLKRHLLGTKNVTGIYALAPMTHLQTANNYPDMAAIGYIQPFALLNQITMGDTTANSYPINTAYAPGDVPGGVVEPSPYITGAQGLAFNDLHGNNIALATRIINASVVGFYVFSAPWETISALMTSINNIHGYNLNLPASYAGPNTVYAISIPPSGAARLVTYKANLNPPSSYPVLPTPVAAASCTWQTYFSATRTGGVNGVVIPPGTNTNQTVYLIRHAEAHPGNNFEDGNFVGAGQWRALSLPNFLPNALRGLPSPTAVYAIDPAQSFALTADFGISYVRPSLTVLPYAVANNLPYYLVAGFYISDPNDPAAARATSDFLFTNLAGVNLSNQTILLAWEHLHYPPLVTYLIQSYGGTVPAPPLLWPEDDYDTIWTVTLDAQGNLTVNNALCEGIDSASLPVTAPQF